MAFPTVREIMSAPQAHGACEVRGWVKTHRQSKKVSFVELSDGTTVRGLQLVIDPALSSYAACVAQVVTGAAIIARGEVIDSPAKGQRFEMKVTELHVVGEADPETYPLQKKEHTHEFLREILHFRPRSATFGAVFRVRSAAGFAVHRFFQERGFYYVHTPIISTSDCEGAGEMFHVTTLDLANVPKVNGQPDYSQDFFKEMAGLTVSGQLEAETFATALSKVYTFGPTFRAENSNTTRHLSEFWMIEPEVAFADLESNMALGEEFIKYLIRYLLDNCPEEMEFLHRTNAAEGQTLEGLRALVDSKFEALDYTDAIKILESSGEHFEFPVRWGIDLQSEHERFLTDKHIKGPVYVVNYPKEIKAFYMRVNPDGKTVRAMDMLVPRLGEIIGGSQREERYEVLLERIRELGLPEQNYWWYLDLRKFGTVPHAGFGLGFERFLMYVTGTSNIRDVTPFPRHPGFAKF
ncbi:MAG: asparagine--tRNA ligase [Oligoflexia bacterium]|nr:asparagine--tRNA ligase [Oligoflexia bacterium]